MLQKGGYRSKVVTIARASGIAGSVQNIPDCRVKVISEGERAEDEKRYHQCRLALKKNIRVQPESKQDRRFAGQVVLWAK